MSMDDPNIYEQAIEDYATAVRHETAMKAALKAASDAYEAAQQNRQERWRKVSAYVNQGLIKPGVYRLNQGPGSYAEAILIQPYQDYPDLFPYLVCR